MMACLLILLRSANTAVPSASVAVHRPTRWKIKSGDLKTNPYGKDFLSGYFP